jgi:hypothetical protein
MAGRPPARLGWSLWLPFANDAGGDHRGWRRTGWRFWAAFTRAEDDGAPAGTRTLLLLGPAEPGFWPHLTAQPEWLDGAPTRWTAGRAG